MVNDKSGMRVSATHFAALTSRNQMTIIKGNLQQLLGEQKVVFTKFSLELICVCILTYRYGARAPTKPFRPQEVEHLVGLFSC